MVELGIANFFIGIGGIPAPVKPTVTKQSVFGSVTYKSSYKLVPTANRYKLLALVKHLYCCGHSNILAEHGFVPSKNAISLMAKD
jgi:hypothetical protein